MAFLYFLVDSTKHSSGNISILTAAWVLTHDASTGLWRIDWVTEGTVSMYDASTELWGIDWVAKNAVGVVVRMVDMEAIVGGFCTGDTEV
eukprot:9188878-Ditylum_brightwellii.AAC.1